MIQIISIAISLVLFVAVIDLIRRGLLKEKYSVLWLASMLFVIVLAVWKELLARVSMLVGVAYPPTLLFLVAFLFVILILLHYSVAISSLSEKNKILAQEIALLKNRIHDKQPLSEEKR